MPTMDFEGSGIARSGTDRRRTVVVVPDASDIGTLQARAGNDVWVEGDSQIYPLYET